MTTTPSATLARFSAELTFDGIPEAVIERAKLCILDGLGCALYAAGLEWGRVTAAYAESQGGPAEAGLWGYAGRVTAANAALVNGTLVHGFELDDLHKASILHPTSVALPAALAVAEAQGHMTGRDLLTAYVAGAEAGIRAGNCVGTVQLQAGFHPTGTLGPIAAAGAAARIMGLDAATMLHALSIGATQGAGLMSAQFESMVKRVHAGRAAQSGVMAAHLAALGLSGIDTVFENDYGGFCKTFGGADADLGPLTDGLGEVFETANVGFKGHAACGSSHTTIDALLALRAEHGIGADDVAAIEVETTTATYLHVGFPYTPGGVTRAQMNLPYAAAVTLADGEAFVDQFSPRRIADPALVDLAARVRVRPAADLDALGRGGRHTVRVRVATHDGRTLAAERRHARGSTADPLGVDDVIEKYRRLAGGRIGPGRAAELMDAVMTLDEAPDLTRLLAPLAVAP